MSYSYGNNLYNDLLKYANKQGDDEAAIHKAYHLQSRLHNYYSNNDKPTLLNSQKYSSETYNGKPVPLGGPIDWEVGGTRNAPKTPGCPPDFNFWAFKDIPEEKKPVTEKPVTKKNIAAEKHPIKEYFESNLDSNHHHHRHNKKSGSNDYSMILWIIIPLIVIILVILMCK